MTLPKFFEDRLKCSWDLDDPSTSSASSLVDLATEHGVDGSLQEFPLLVLALFLRKNRNQRGSLHLKLKQPMAKVDG